jgi:hypothetical protein
MVIKIFRKTTRNEQFPLSEGLLLPFLDVDRAAWDLEQSGYTPGTVLPAKIVNEVLEYCSKMQSKKYGNPHLSCEVVSRIAHDPKIVGVAKRYLGVEPILYATRIYWTFPRSNRAKLTNSPDIRQFHYDVNDFKSLTVFVYLTDVDIDCGPHVVIEGTHGKKSLKQLINPYLKEDLANKAYGKRIKAITGEKGTLFFEDLTCYHQHATGTKPRLVLTINYLLQRKPEFRFLLRPRQR